MPLSRPTGFIEATLDSYTLEAGKTSVACLLDGGLIAPEEVQDPA